MLLENKFVVSPGLSDSVKVGGREGKKEARECVRTIRMKCALDSNETAWPLSSTWWIIVCLDSE